jgi:hypothetical protein
VADVQADGDAAVLLDVAVDFEGAVEDVFCVFAFEFEKRFVAGAEEAEDLVLTLGAHLARVFVFFGKGMAKGLLYSGARDNDVAGCVWAGDNLGLWGWKTAFGGWRHKVGRVSAIWPRCC